MKKIFLTVFIFAGRIYAQDASPWVHESEASIVIVGGNTTSESYSAKQKTNYKFDANLLVATGRYLQARSGGVETAKQWDAALRYERELSSVWSVFAQYGAESDFFAGHVQRDNIDVGGKYHFIKDDVQNFFFEIGYRNTSTNLTVSSPTRGKHYSSDFGRVYTEYNRKLNETVGGKLWAEYLPDLNNSEAYLINYEPSMSVMLTQTFSLKVGYLVKYHNSTTAVNEKKTDTTFTTALVAKF